MSRYKELWKQSAWRGFCRKCPACGTGNLLKGYLETNAACPSCGLDLTPFVADDAPAYFTMSIIMVFILPLAAIHEYISSPPYWVYFVFWLPALMLSAYLMLPRAKGIFIGLLWALKEK